MPDLIFSAAEFPRGCVWFLGQKFVLRFTHEGNLELRESGNNALVWETRSKGEKLVMQGDGNLVVYDGGAKPAWSSGTGGNPGAFFRASEEGSIRITTSDGKRLWSAFNLDWRLKKSR